MEIKIVINSQNKEKILALLDELVRAEEVAKAEAEPNQVIRTSDVGIVLGTSHSQIDSCIQPGEVCLTSSLIAQHPLGTWAMFNSFLPGKATLRVLGHMLRERNSETVPFGELIDQSSRAFKNADLSRLRGFPGSGKASSVPRFATHLVLPFADMALVSRSNGGVDAIGLTDAGLQFSRLNNPVLDDRIRQTRLAPLEIKWLVEYLKTLDDHGFKEYSILKAVAEFIDAEKPSRERLVEWFYNRDDFRQYTKSQSRHANEPVRLRKQMLNLASTYVTSKIALLRELGVLSDVRGVYEVMSTL